MNYILLHLPEMFPVFPAIYPNSLNLKMDFIFTFLYFAFFREQGSKKNKHSSTKPLT